MARSLLTRAKNFRTQQYQNELPTFGYACGPCLLSVCAAPACTCYSTVSNSIDSYVHGVHLCVSSYHLPAKLIPVIRAVHDGSRAAVRAYGRVSESFDVTCGVRQRCVLASIELVFQDNCAKSMCASVSSAPRVLRFLTSIVKWAQLQLSHGSGDWHDACGMCLRSTYMASAMTKFIPSYFTSVLHEITFEHNTLSITMNLQLCPFFASLNVLILSSIVEKFCRKWGP